jgi:hypothetical protein
VDFDGCFNMARSFLIAFAVGVIVFVALLAMLTG